MKSMKRNKLSEVLADDYNEELFRQAWRDMWGRCDANPHLQKPGYQSFIESTLEVVVDDRRRFIVVVWRYVCRYLHNKSLCEPWLSQEVTEEEFIRRRKLESGDVALLYAK